MECNFNEPPLSKLDNHYQLVKQSVENLPKPGSNISGILGSRFSTRYRTVNLLDEYLKAHQNKFDLYYTEETQQKVEAALNEVYNNPMLESTKNNLSQMFRNKFAPQRIIDFILSVFESGNLCRTSNDGFRHTDPDLICSLSVLS